jgi:ABC-2 type transport system permease protein
MLFLIYPIAFLPAGLAYLARYAFDTQTAFFAVLAVDAVIGLIVYRIALESAVEAAERLKEKMVASLSLGDGPITG